MPPSRLERRVRLLLTHPLSEAVRRAAGEVPSHLVGGILRDRFLGLPSRDFDVAVERGGQVIAGRLAAALPARLVRLGGEEFAAYRLVADAGVVDLWDREGAELASDLARRDFTVNALALALAGGGVDGGLVDPCGGLPDLASRTLRAATEKSLAADPLRVVRLARLVVQLPGFAADPATLALASRSAAAVTAVASERIREELRLLLASDEAHRGVAMLHAVGLYPGLWLGTPGAASGGGAAGVAVRELEELAAVLVALRSRLGAGVEIRPAVTRWAILFSALPAAAPPERALEGFREAGYLVRRTAGEVASLLAHPTLPVGVVAQRRFLHALGPLWPAAAALLGARAAVTGERDRWAATVDGLVELAGREGTALFDPPTLVDGREAQRILGLPPGPEIGRALARIREAQVEGRVGTREEAIALLRDSVERG